MSRMLRINSITFALFCGLAHPGVGKAQYASASLAAESGAIVLGERMEFGVKLGRLHLGHATMAVEALDEVAGTAAYRTILNISIGAPLLGYQDRMVSWIAPQPFRSLAFEQRDKSTESGRRRYDFDGDVLDEVAALYLLRTLPLNPGDTYEFNRYFTTAGNPITFRVVGREKVRVPAGRFETIVIEPVIPSLFVFKPGANARIYLSDDARRIVVQMETHTKIGKLTFYMTEYEAGTLP